MTARGTHRKWEPPFCSNDAPGLKCPKCGEQCVEVREHDTYMDANEVEAYCSECHADLYVTSHVEITFSDPEIADDYDT
jgi:hypothetical protein